MTPLRPLLLACLLAAPALALAEDVPTVVQRDRQFSVESLSVPRGGAVLFVNADSVRHNIALRTPDGEDRTGIVQAPGESSRLVFDRDGLFQVHCLIHPQMHLAVEAR